MLRRQSPEFDKSSFLAGSSTMARMIRDFDWSDHPLGPPDRWPAALRSALGIALNSAFPTCVYWGPDLRLLYNDSWSSIPGPRHPACLGEPAIEVWPDIWHIIEPQFTQVISSGEGVFVRDQMLPMRRFGVDEETYWTYNFTPIRMDDGSIGGILNSGNETTAQVLQQKKTSLLLELSDLFRTVTDLSTVRDQALEMLGHHLGADRVGLRQVVPSLSQTDLVVAAQWVAPGVAPITVEMGQEAIASDAWGHLMRGHVLRFDGTVAMWRDSEERILSDLDTTSAIAVPWMEDGRAVAILFVHSGRTRHWTNMEIETVEDVLARLMMLMDRARAAERERLMSNEINHRSRNMLSVVQAIVRLSRSEEPEVMRAKLLSRLRSLSKSHTLLADQRWEPVALRQLIEQELDPYLGAPGMQVELVGAHVLLSSAECEAIGMVVHELATNAAKYGGLSAQDGRLRVEWTLTDDDRLLITWAEQSSAEVPEDALEEEGFGSRLMRLMIEGQLGGRLTREVGDAGMRCVIDVQKAPDLPVASGPLSAD